MRPPGWRKVKNIKEILGLVERSGHHRSTFLQHLISHFHDLSVLTPGLLLIHALVATVCSIVLLSTYTSPLQQWRGYRIILLLLIFHLKPLSALQIKFRI